MKCSDITTKPTCLDLVVGEAACEKWNTSLFRDLRPLQSCTLKTFTFSSVKILLMLWFKTTSLIAAAEKHNSLAVATRKKRRLAQIYSTQWKLITTFHTSAKRKSLPIHLDMYSPWECCALQLLWLLESDWKAVCWQRAVSSTSFSPSWMQPPGVIVAEGLFLNIKHLYY